MKTTLDCVPCLVRQALAVARIASDDPAIHRRALSEAMSLLSETDLTKSPPELERLVRHRLIALTGKRDFYRDAKIHQNELALEMIPEVRAMIEAADDPLVMAARMAIAGNVIDLGVNSHMSHEFMFETIRNALAEPFHGDWAPFKRALAETERILYLADNAGEIVFDRLLIEQIGPQRVTLAVRGAPVLNDALREDVRQAGFPDSVEVIDNGADAPGTVMEICAPAFRERYDAAELIIAKGQGNFESLNETAAPVFFLFKAKCPVAADLAGVEVGTHVLLPSAKSLPLVFADKGE